MARQTARDRIWIHALNQAIRQRQAVYPAEIAEDADVSERTARDALKDIAGANFLVRSAEDDGTIRYLPPRDIEVTHD